MAASLLDRLFTPKRPIAKNIEIARPRHHDIVTSDSFVGHKRRIMSRLHSEVEKTMNLAPP